MLRKRSHRSFHFIWSFALVAVSKTVRRIDQGRACRSLSPTFKYLTLLHFKSLIFIFPRVRDDPCHSPGSYVMVYLTNGELTTTVFFLQSLFRPLLILTPRVHRCCISASSRTPSNTICLIGGKDIRLCPAFLFWFPFLVHTYLTCLCHLDVVVRGVPFALW